MKKINKILCAIAAIVCVFAFAAIAAACSDTSGESSAKEYTITLKLNEEQDWDSFTGKKGAEIEFTKSDPIRANSVFKGWSLTPDGETVELPTVMPAADQTYYAVFVRYYTLTLRAGSGTLDGETQIRAELGQSLYSLVQDITPAAPGVSVFDGWYYGNKKIDADSDEVMPANTIALDAKYSVSYTINIYKQTGYNTDSYTEVAADKVENIGFVDSSPLDSEYPTYTGYELNEQKSGSTSAFVLSANGGNVFDAYYNVEAYRLVFNSNTPAEEISVGGSMGAAEWGYDEVNTIPDCTYSITGYRFMYWSTVPNGTDRIDVGDTYKITNNTTLYAIWSRGYADISGRSYDYIYLFEDENGSTEVYLDRYYLDELVGEYDAINHTFTFKNDLDEVVLHGKLDLDGYTFVYINTDSYVLHKLYDSTGDVGGYLDEGVTLALSDNGSAVYRDGNAAAIVGTYAADNTEGSMKFAANDGSVSFYFRLSQYSSGGAATDVFEVRSDAEVGDWCRLTAAYEQDTNFVITLNGYGEAVMHAVSTLYSTTADYAGYYRYAPDGVDGRIELYSFFITSYGTEINKIVLIDGSNIAAADAAYTKFYKEWESAVTIYAKPAEGTELDIATADKITLDGYGLFDDSAAYTRGNTTVMGKYTLQTDVRTLVFDPVDGSAITYFINTATVGLGNDATTYLVYESIESDKSELNKLYAVSGLENYFRPGVAYGFRFFNDNVAMLYVLLPEYNETFNVINSGLQPIIVGTYASTDVSGEYLFTATIPSDVVSIIQLYYTQVFGFSYALDISNFGDFKFKFVGATTAEVTAIGDGYAGYSIVDNGATYVTDGYGKAKVTNSSGIVTDSRDYVIIESMGLPCMYLIWETQELNTSNQLVTVTKQVLYTLIDGQFREHAGEYNKYNTAYSSQIYDTNVRMIVYDDDYAVLAYYNSSTRGFCMYSWGRINWTGSQKQFGAYEEHGVVSATGSLLRALYGDFKFGFVQTENDSAEVGQFFIYDGSVTDTASGKILISGEDGATLILDLNKVEAEYIFSNGEDGNTTISGEFKLREGIVSIVYEFTESDQTYIGIVALKLEYSGTQISSFKQVGLETGTWQDATGQNGTLYLSGDAAETAGEFIGTMQAYDSATGGTIELNGTYYRTDNTSATEYVFKYTVELDEPAEGDDGVRSFRFAIGYDSNMMPIYRIYSMEVGVLLYGSITSTMPSYMLSGGGYNDLVLMSTTGSQTVGQLLIYPNVSLFISGATLYAFATNTATPEPILFFTIIGSGDSARGIVLDRTFIAANFGVFECDDAATLTLPVLKDDDSGEYEDTDITVSRIAFNGLGTALIVTSDDRALTCMYLPYSSNTYAFVSLTDDSINIIALFRLYTSTSGSDDDDAEAETRYIIRFDDSELRRTFVGAGYTAFITDGFGSAVYTDSRGVLYSCIYERVAEGSDIVKVTYLDGMAMVQMYIEVDAESGTFEVLDSNDARIPESD